MELSTKTQNPADYFPSYPHIELGRTIDEVLQIAEVQGLEIEPLIDTDPLVNMFGEGRTFLTGLSKFELHYVLRELIEKFSDEDQSSPVEIINSLSHSARSVAGFAGDYPLVEIQLVEKMLKHMPTSTGYLAMGSNPHEGNEGVVCEPLPDDETRFNLAFRQGNCWLRNAFGEGKDLCTNLTETEMDKICDEFNRLEADRPGSTLENLREASSSAEKI